MEGPQIFSSINSPPVRLTAPIGVKHGEHSVIRPEYRTAPSHGAKINAEAGLNRKLRLLLLLPHVLAGLKNMPGPCFARTPKSKGQSQDGVEKVLVEPIPAWPTLE